MLATIAWAWFLPPLGTLHIDQLADVLNLFTVAGINVLIVGGFSIARRQLQSNRDLKRRP